MYDVFVWIGINSKNSCGFSSAMVQLLNSNGIIYDSFDILSDATIREGLKEFASWPTFPMLFVQG